MLGLAEVETMEDSDRQNRYADSLAEALRNGTVLVVGPVTDSELNLLLEEIGDDERIQRITVPEFLEIRSDQEHRWDSYFDAVVCEAWDEILDVKALLPALRQSLKPNGKLFLQVQNTRHQSVVNQLLQGRWRQNGSCRTARRYYTKNEIEKLLFRGGFEVAGIQPEIDEETPSFPADETSTFSLIGRLQVGALKECDLEDFYTKKYSIVATKQSQQLRPLNSIVILTHNQVAYTRLCIDSIRRFTDEPYELIVVDNASTDSTSSYLQSLGDVKTIFNRTNRGFPAAVNQGMELANGEYVLLLNNDTIATTGWLRRMQQAMESDPRIGLVGPVSNNVSGRQQVICEIDDLACLDGFAWERGKTHASRLRDSDRLVGFCLLIKQELIEQIGNLDERFGIGCFEDDDFCRRAIHAGYRAVIADDSFVYHFGSITFRNSAVDFAELMSENQQKYDQKWEDESTETNSDPENCSQTDWKVKPSDTGGLLLEKQTCKLSLCMIVRDNENTIEPCLKSIKPWVDEIIVVDTGSLDRTPEICKQFGAKLFRFPWCDDFSRARNESLKYASGEWLFWMDSDDTIPAECGRKLKDLAAGMHDENIMGYVMQVHCPGKDNDHEKDLTVVDHVKMFRNRKELRFEHRIHEQIIPAIRRAGGDVAFTDIYVVHSGSDRTPEGRVRKLERDYKLLELDLKERPDHPFVLFNLGMTYADDERHDEAISYLQRCVSVSQPNESHLRKAFALLIGSFSQANRHHEAWLSCVEGLNLYPDDKELHFRAAMLHHHFERYEDAVRAYLRVIEENEDRHFTSIDAELADYKARHNLALVYEDMGKMVLAEEQWRLALKEHPDSSSDWRGFGECLLKQNKKTDIEALITELKINQNLAPVGAILEARLLEHEGSIQRASEFLEHSAYAFPDDLEIQNELCRLLFYHGTPEKAEAALRRLLEIDPQDASGWHNLGVVYSQQGKNQLAKEAFETSLRIRPDSESTQKHRDDLTLREDKTKSVKSEGVVEDSRRKVSVKECSTSESSGSSSH